MIRRLIRKIFIRIENSSKKFLVKFRELVLRGENGKSSKKCLFWPFRSNNANTPKRGRMARRGAPYRNPPRQFQREPAFNDWSVDQQAYQPWQQTQWSPPKFDSQPLPPGESRPPQRFGQPPDMSKIRCFSCFKYGHKSPNCPDKQTQ